MEPEPTGINVKADRSRFVRGKKIATLIEFSDRLQAGLPFYWNHKFLAAGFIEHWSIIMIKNSINAGVLHAADKYSG